MSSICFCISVRIACMPATLNANSWHVHIYDPCGVCARLTRFFLDVSTHLSIEYFIYEVYARNFKCIFLAFDSSMTVVVCVLD